MLTRQYHASKKTAEKRDINYEKRAIIPHGNGMHCRDGLNDYGDEGAEGAIPRGDTGEYR